jgi:hypothetical protein
MKITNKIALYRLIYYSKTALHVSGDMTLVGFACWKTHRWGCFWKLKLNWLMKNRSQLKFPLAKRLKLKRLAHAYKGTEAARRSWIRASRHNYEDNQQDALYRLMYYSKSALHVSDDVFVHQQEHMTVFTVSGSVHPSCRLGWTLPDTVNTVKWS